MILLLSQQSAWWICALAAGAGHPGLAFLAVAAFCLAHAVTTRHPPREVTLMVVAAAIGAAGDGILVGIHAITFPAASALGPLPAPLWMAALWSAFAALLTGPLAWLAHDLRIAAVLGAVAGPLAYRGGEMTGGLTVGGTTGLLQIGVLYAIAVPLLAAVARGTGIDHVLDATIVFSFDRTGFARHSRSFAPGDPGPAPGRVILVTGASSGLGRAAAGQLAALGCRVRLVCRDAGRGAEAMRAIAASVPGADLVLDLVDVSDLDAVRRYAANLPDEAIDGLVHNAGLLPADRLLSPQGLEATFATHVAGPWLLTHALESRLRRPGARVIFVSSGGMYPVKLSLEDLDWSRRPYDGVSAYAMTKRMQVVLATSLHERLEASGVHVYAMHPGWADTAAVRTALPLFHRMTHLILRTPAQGADTIVWLAATREAPPAGGFWFDRREVSAHLSGRTRESPTEREAFLRRLDEITGAREGAACIVAG